jgi:tetratricopeptide (TPR) repeat protein
MLGRLIRYLRGTQVAESQPAETDAKDTRKPQATSARSDELTQVLSRISEARARGDLEGTKAFLETALGQYPDDPELNLRAGEIWMLSADAEQALDFFRLALYYDGTLFEACDGLVSALTKLGRRGEISKVLESFLQRNPMHVKASISLADYWYTRGQHAMVVTLLEPLMVQVPVDRGVANLLGLVLGRELGEFDRSEKYLRMALMQDPNWLPALTNLGWILLEQGRTPEGREYIEKALSISPMEGETRLVRACMNLKQARFEEGWRDYDARLESRHAAKRPYQFPSWKGESLSNKTILVFAEQGVGDQIMFASCFSELRHQAKRVIVECNPKLVRIFQRSFPWAEIQESVPVGTEPHWLKDAGNIDVQCAMGSLPGFFRNQWSDFPRHSGYLLADTDRVNYWRERLTESKRPRNYGLSWRGGSVVTRKHLRTIPVSTFSALRDIDCGWVSLQYDDVKEDLPSFQQAAGLTLHHWQDAIDEYDETAALVVALDGVLSVCTSIIHLAGALGRPVWILAPTITEWRYLDKGEKLPWYPSATMIRQRKTGEWDDAIRDAVKLISAQGH